MEPSVQHYGQWSRAIRSSRYTMPVKGYIRGLSTLHQRHTNHARFHGCLTVMIIGSLMILFQSHGGDLGLEMVVIRFLEEILNVYSKMIASYSYIYNLS
jgi:membrane-bound lytic murein transglycosylase MltF